MPKFAEDTTLEEHKVGTFGFTAQALEELEASGYTVVDLVFDCSLSTEEFIDAMGETLIGALIALKGDSTVNPPIKPHPRADQMLVRLVTFATDQKEEFGYVLLNSLDIGSLKGVLSARGATAMFDAIISSAEAASNMGRLLQDDDYDANGIQILITDGGNNRGKYGAGRQGNEYYPDKDTYLQQLEVVANALKQPRKSENLESYVSIMIGVNCDEWEDVLREIHELAGFTQDFIALHDATPETISKIGEFISESVSSQSEAQGTGGPSQQIASKI